jgi:hypothetical protein
MRVLVARYPGEALPGYLNLGPAGDVPPALQYQEVPGLADFGDAVLVGEAEEVFVPSALDAVPEAELPACLAYWGGRLSATGKLVVSGLDLLTLAYRVDADGFRYDKARDLLFSWRKAAYAAEEVREALGRAGLVVETVDVSAFNYTITAARPKG